MKKILTPILALCFLSLIACTGGGSSTSSGSSSGAADLGNFDVSASSGGAAGTGSGSSSGGGSSSSGTSSTQPAVDIGSGGTGSGTNNGTGGGGGGSGGTGGGGGGGGGETETIVPVSVSPSIQPTTTRDSRRFIGETLSSGTAVIGVDAQNTTSFQVIVAASGQNIIARLLDPASTPVVFAQDPLDGPQQTISVFPLPNVNVMPFPTGYDDGSVVSGMYRNELALFTGSTPVRASFGGAVVAKRDPDTSNGLLRVNIHLYGNDALRTENRFAINQAVSAWSTIYANRGIALDVAIIDGDFGAGALPSLVSGDNFYLTRSAAQRADALNIFIGSSVADGEVLGIAGGIPGANPTNTDEGVLATVKTAVAVDLTNHDFDTPQNGIIEGPEVGRLAETFAHESGHYLGLFHPNECADSLCASGNFIPNGDLLSDTANCSTYSGCSSTGVLFNLMFPVPPTDSFTPQRDLSVQQGRVLNLQVMVD